MREEPEVRSGLEIQDLVDIQGTLAWITKRELRDELKKRGAEISERQLTNYVTQGLLPPSVRVGSRAGTYPKIVIDLAFAITRGRQSGLSVEAIREIIPVWKHLARARRRQHLDLRDFEYTARRHITNLEAAYAVPWLLRFALPSPIFEPDEAAQLRITYKDGTSRRHSPDSPIEIEFVIAEQDDETNEVRRRSSLRISFPAGDDERSVILGIPNGVELPSRRPELGAEPETEPESSAPPPAARSRVTRAGRPRAPRSRPVQLVRDGPGQESRTVRSSLSRRSRAAGQ